MLNLLVLLVAGAGIYGGYRKGLSRRASGVLGFAFGVVAARIVAEESAACARMVIDTVAGEYYADFVWSATGTSVTFVAVYAAVACATKLLDRLLGTLAGGMLDRIFGAVFGLMINMMFLSVALNLVLAFRPESDLRLYAAHGDGNLVEEVMLLSPSLLGGEDVEDLYHAGRMMEAKKIS